MVSGSVKLPYVTRPYSQRSLPCATKRIQLGTSILNVFTRTPSQLALLAATLNEFSGGRFTLGLGVSTAAIVENWHGQPFQKPNHRLDETVRLLRQYFSGEKVSYDGVYSSPKGARMRTAFPTEDCSSCPE